jgi:tetratricopeptide (TPR) repeat protein
MAFDPVAYEKLRANLAQLRAMRVDESDPSLAAALDARIAKLDAELADMIARNPAEIGGMKKSFPGKLSPEQILQEALANAPKKAAPASEVIPSSTQPAVVESPATPVEPSLPPKTEDVLEPTEEETVPPPTPEQMVEADRLVQLARVEKMRGNAARSTELLQQATAVAPGAPSVLEMLGDDFKERKRFKEARDAYGKAVKLDPKNVGLETKFAEMVLRGGSTVSVEEMLRMNLSDSPFINPDDQVASASTATFLNLFAPGLGQLVMGRTALGAGILLTWLVCVGFLVFFRSDLGVLFQTVAGRSSKTPTNVVLPLVIAAMVHLGAILNTASLVKSGGRRPKAEHPVPPVNLPFE